MKSFEYKSNKLTFLCFIFILSFDEARVYDREFLKIKKIDLTSEF